MRRPVSASLPCSHREPNANRADNLLTKHPGDAKRPARSSAVLPVQGGYRRTDITDLLPSTGDSRRNWPRLTLDT